MALASDYWTVVGDTLCHTYLEAIIEPENQLLRTMFLMDLNATIRRLQSSDVHEEEIIEDNVRISENQDSIELQYNPNDNFLRELQGVALSKKLQELQVPIEARGSLVDTILFRASEFEWKYQASRKILRMRVEVDLYVIDDDTDGGVETCDYGVSRFVPASALPVEKLRRTKAEVSSTVGSEATLMPCSHLYHGHCIV
ncbi:hypothetical protein ACLB2K_022848 [Fragaria x ananassa]